ncbi:MAG: NADH-quinone oxidoreductase subunit M [Kineosporiaceae bacterium]
MTGDQVPWLLPALVGAPLAAAFALLCLRRLPDALAGWAAVLVAAGTGGLGVLAVVAAGPYGGRAESGPRLQLDVAWIEALGVRFHLGLDGLSAPLVLLTCLLTLLVTVHLLRVRPPAGQVRALLAAVLTVEAGALGTFTAADAVVFFVAFELVLLPMWFVIAQWGDAGAPGRRLEPAAPQPGGPAARRDAANRFLLFTAVGSAVMLLGILLVGLRAGTTDLTVLAARHGEGLSDRVQLVAAALLLLGLAVKVPMWPLHTWLPPAHSTAPTAGSVLLAGVLLKMGTYGMLRLAVPVVPDGVRTLAPYLACLGVVGILWGGFACLVERDLKRLVAFSSVAHMGFVLLGIASLTPAGLQGAMFANVAHGLIAGLLFLVAGAIKDRHGHSGDLAVIGPGLRDRLPRLGWLLAFGAVAGLGLPGLAGFWGELLAVVGAWDSEALRPLGPVLTVVAAFGMVLAAAYLLRVLRLIWQGPRETPEEAGEAFAPVLAGDARPLELLVAAPLVAAIVVIGLVPSTVLDVTSAAARRLAAATGQDAGAADPSATTQGQP